MTKKFVRVPAEGITAEELLALWRKGKLYWETKVWSEEELLAHSRQEALRYVAAIGEFVAPEWMPCIDGLWHEIVEDVAFASGLMMQKGRDKGQLNRYLVTNIVYRLREMGIYRSESFLLLHKKMEGVKEKTRFYKASVMYPLNKKQRMRLRELKDSFDGQK